MVEMVATIALDTVEPGKGKKARSDLAERNMTG